MAYMVLNGGRGGMLPQLVAATRLRILTSCSPAESMLLKRQGHIKGVGESPVFTNQHDMQGPQMLS